MPVCINNTTGIVCSGRGHCTASGQCFCLHYYFGPTCTDASLRVAGLVFNWSMFSIYAIVMLACVWRLAVVVRFKISQRQQRAKKGASQRPVCLDSQVLPLLPLLVVFSMRTAYFVDPWCRNGWMSCETISYLQFVASAFALICGGLIVRVFLVIQTRIHPPSKLVLLALDYFTAIVPSLSILLGCVVYQFNNSLAFVVANVVSVAFLIGMITGLSVHSVQMLSSVLKVNGQDTAVAIGTRALIRKIRLMQLFVSALLVIIIATLPFPVTPVMLVVQGFGFRVPELFACIIALLIFGRKGSDESNDDTADTGERDTGPSHQRKPTGTRVTGAVLTVNVQMQSPARSLRSVAQPAGQSENGN